MWSGKSVYSSSLKINDSYDWATDNGTISGNSIVINKVTSDSKGTLVYNSSGKSLTYYTTNWTPALKYLEKATVDTGTITDKATFTWNNPDVSSFTTVTQDKMIFRIVKKSAGLTETIDGVTVPKHYFRPFTNKDSLLASDTDLSNFISGNGTYVDLIFDSGIASTKESPDKSTSFLYSTNNSLQITGLPRGDYSIQIYNLQGEDIIAQSDETSIYRVLTYGEYSEFKMGLPSVVTSDKLSKQNNFFVINSKNFVESLENGNPVRKLNIELVTKSQQRLNLNKNNIISRKSEVNPQGGILGNARESIVNGGVTRDSNVSNLNINEGRGEFQYPLDVVFLLDNSGSMAPSITNVRNGLSAFTNDLKARNFDVNYNIITFGTWQDADRLGSWNNYVTKVDTFSGNSPYPASASYTAIFKNPTGTNEKWFNPSNSTELTSLQTAFTDIADRVKNGYIGGPENAFHAIHHGINYLNSNGRYLDFNNKIYTGSDGADKGYIKSQKMIVLLTDENASIYNLPEEYSSIDVVAKISDKLKDFGINLTAIFKTSLILYNEADKEKYSASGYNFIESNEGVERYLTYNGNDYKVDSNNGYLTAYGNYIFTTSNGYVSQNSFQNNVDYRLYISGQWRLGKGKIVSRKKLTFSDNLNATGNLPLDSLLPGQGKFINEFLLQNLGSKFRMYSIDSSVENSLKDSANGLGIVQTWNMTYNSPFPESDGLEREAIFSLTGITKTGTNELLDVRPIINGKDRFYQVPEQRLEAYFENPSSIAKRLIRSYNSTYKKQTIELRAIAQSQFRGQDGKIYNYPITKGNFCGYRV